TIYVHSECALQKCLDRQWISRSSVNRGLRHVEFEVLGELEADLCAAQVRLGMQGLPVLPDCWPEASSGEITTLDKLLSRQLSDKSRQAYIPEIAENPRQSKRADPIDAEHVVKRRNVVRKNHRAAFTGTPPQAAFSIRELPVGKVHAHISVQQLEATGGGDGSRRRIRWQSIDRADEIER